MKRRKQIGLNLRVLRESMNYTQSFVADNLGVATNTYSLMEKGLAQLTLDRIEILSELYKVSPSELISMSGTAGKVPSTVDTEKHKTRGRPLNVMSKELIITYLDQLDEHMLTLKDLVRRLRDNFEKQS